MAFRRRDDGFQTFSLLELLTRPFRIAGGWLGGLLETSDGLETERGFVGTLLAILFLPFKWVVAWISFMIHSWAVTRGGWAFLLAVPAVLAMVGLLGGLWLANFLKDSRSEAASQGYYQFFLKDPDFGPNVALLFAKKLVGLKPDSEEYKFQLGETLEITESEKSKLSSFSLNEFTRSRDVMSSLAPNDRAGFYKAHVWMARSYFRPQADLDEQERDALVVKHLEFAEATEPDSPETLLGLSDYHSLKAKKMQAEASTESVEAAKAEVKASLDYLEKLLNQGNINSQLVAVPRMMPLLLELDEKQGANLRLNAAIKSLSKWARLYPDEFALWAGMVNSCIGLKDYEQAQKIVAEGLQLTKDPEVAQRLNQLSQLILANQIEDFNDLSDRKQFTDRLKLLSVGVAKYPIERSLYRGLLFYVNEKSNPDFNLSWLQQSLLDNENPAIVHILLGVHKISQGDVLGGQKHWRIAEQQFQATQFVINNLIGVAVQDYPDDFENMVDVATLAIELFPNQPLFYQTRGEHFKRLNRFKEAIADFETADKTMPKNLSLSLRTNLIECYTKLNQADKANEQRAKLQDLLVGLNIEERRNAEQFIKQRQDALDAAEN